MLDPVRFFLRGDANPQAHRLEFEGMLKNQLVHNLGHIHPFHLGRHILAAGSLVEKLMRVGLGNSLPADSSDDVGVVGGHGRKQARYQGNDHGEADKPQDYAHNNLQKKVVAILKLLQHATVAPLC